MVTPCLRKGFKMEKYPETMNIDNVKYVREDTSKENKTAISSEGLTYVIARCKDAGVHAGYLLEVNKNSRYAILINARRLWRWNSRDNTLSGLANNGFYSSQECKVGETISRIQLSEWCELLDCTERSRRAIEDCPTWEFGGNK